MLPIQSPSQNRAHRSVYYSFRKRGTRTQALNIARVQSFSLSHTCVVLVFAGIQRSFVTPCGIYHTTGNYTMQPVIGYNVIVFISHYNDIRQCLAVAFYRNVIVTPLQSAVTNLTSHQYLLLSSPSLLQAHHPINLQPYRTHHAVSDCFVQELRHLRVVYPVAVPQLWRRASLSQMPVRLVTQD